RTGVRAALAGRWTGWCLSLPLIVLTGLFVVAPLVGVAGDSFSGEDPLRNYARFFTSQVSVRALVVTLVLSLLVTVLAVALGGPLAWMIRTTRHRALRVVCWAAVLMPFWMSVVVKNYAFTLLLGRRGVLNSVLQSLFGDT